MSVFKKNETDLYEEMSQHESAVILTSTAPSQAGKQKSFSYLYVDDEKYMLGQGSFGRVFVCFHQGTDRVVKLALKIITIPQRYKHIKTIEHIVSTSRQEILALIKFRQNKNIIKIEDIIREKNCIYIVLEYCNQRDLVYYFQELRKKKQITKEAHVRYYFSQILDAFRDLHKHNFMHRDIKPSNILVNNGVLKIADFGLSRQIFEGQEDKLFVEHVGTMITAAPQIVFKEEYTNKCDIYSLGTILYWMIYDRFPFTRAPTREDFNEHKLEFPECKYFEVSSQMIKLLKEMLAYHEQQRISWVALLENEMFQSHRFLHYEQKMRAYYQHRELEQLRQTYGRDFVAHVKQDDEFLETAIPTSYYKFLREIQGEEELNRWQIEQRNSLIKNPILYAHKKIKDEYRNQDLRIKFYRTVVLELEGVSEHIKTFSHEFELIKDLIGYSVEKYMIHLMNKIKDELVFTTPPEIFQVSWLREAEGEALHQDFVETIIEKVKGSQFMSRFTTEQIKRMQKKCKEYQLSESLGVLFDELNEGNFSSFRVVIDQCIIQFVYFLKSDILKKLNSSFESNPHMNDHPQIKHKVILIHHLFMFSMQEEVFPAQYDSSFPYDSFLSEQQFKDPRKYTSLVHRILKIVRRFE